MKRISPSIPGHRLVLASFLVLTLLLASIPPVCADDAAPTPAGRPQPEVQAKSEGADSKKEAAGAKVATEAKKEEKKEDPEALLIELFKKEENITNSLGMVMVWLPDGYRVGQHEVTQSQFQEAMGNNPSRLRGGQFPVESVTWNEANEFCRKLTEKEVAAGKLPKGYSYSLPTEQQWESFVDEANLKDAITSHLGDRHGPESVGGLGPNKFGLHDVRGNVWEWCSTVVARGGSWRSFEDYLAVGFRWVGAPDQRYDDIGFRVILEGAPQSGKPLSATPLSAIPPQKPATDPK